MSDLSKLMFSRWQHLQASLFPWAEDELGPLSDRLEILMQVLDLLGLEAFVPVATGGPGRPPEDRQALARAFVAKAVLGLDSTAALIDRLQTDRPLRRLCGWTARNAVPSEATFSRAFAGFAESDLPGKVQETLVKRALGDRIIGHVARDATEIAVRERPKKEDPPGPPPPAAKPKRGRPRKGEERPKPSTRLERQPTQTLNEMLADLPTTCDVGTKTNSKGFKESWIGYKLHLDVADGQIPVSCLLTAASVHDSQVAIPLATLTNARITNLYDLMDAGYDAKAIAAHSRSLGHVPVIDFNHRGDVQTKADRQAERKRRAFINIPEPDDRIYDNRTMAERVIGRLKDEFGGRVIRVRGAVKVRCHLLFGILVILADQLRRLAATAPA
jgi:hypothetical protein